MSEAAIINIKIFSLLFFVFFFGVMAFYAYRPKNKNKMKEYANIPLED
jgi:cbb3-type cytochrome oxidase subunit 3